MHLFRLPEVCCKTCTLFRWMVYIDNRMVACLSHQLINIATQDTSLIQWWDKWNNCFTEISVLWLYSFVATFCKDDEMYLFYYCSAKSWPIPISLVLRKCKTFNAYVKCIFGLNCSHHAGLVSLKAKPSTKLQCLIHVNTYHCNLLNYLLSNNFMYKLYLSINNC